MTQEKKPIVSVNPRGLDIINPESYIILPGKTHGSYSYPDLLVAIERTNLGSNWNQSHEALHRENAFMLSIRQYIDFLQLLKSGNVYDGRGVKLESGRIDTILDEILTQRSPWRAEWLDAYFTDVNDMFYINYEHRNINGKLKPQRSESLENCVMGDGYVDLLSANRQGLPTRKSRTQEIDYWPPRNLYVAGFSADSVRVLLGCGRDPPVSSSALGVRAAKIKR